MSTTILAPTVAVDGSGLDRNNDGICLMIPRLTADFVNTGDTHVQMEGLIQAALLDIDYASFYDGQLSSSYSLDDFGEAVKACDHAVGTFAAANGIGDALRAFDVAPDLENEYVCSSHDDEAAHVILTVFNSGLETFRHLIPYLWSIGLMC